ncbi:MAG: Ig-like domain-containing protein [Actinomycetota bacterium]
MRARAIPLTIITIIASAVVGAVPARAAASSTGSVYAWGANANGQLGNGTHTSGSSPARTSALSAVIAVAAGGSHTLALRADGTAFAWGDNGDGELGNNSTINASVPAPVSGLSDAIALAAGQFHSLALSSDGTVRAWGRGSDGQLGTGVATSATTPSVVTGLGDVAAIAAGDAHSLVAKRDGSVWAWGRSADGQAGTLSTIQAVPARIPGIDHAIAVAGGSAHSLALCADGGVVSWGSDRYGQLGDGTTSTGANPTPRRVSGLAHIVSIAAGGNHSLALASDGTVWAWGTNARGELGNGTTNPSATPVKVSGLADVVGIAAGTAHSVAVRSDGSVWAWGAGASGQLGDGTAADHLTPVEATSLTAATMVAAGGAHTVALKPPAVVIDATPPALTNSTSARFDFHSDELVTFVCVLDGAWLPCTSPTTYTSLAEGTHTLEISAENDVGDSSVARYAWLIDTTAPVATFTDGPTSILHRTSASFSFTTNDPDASTRCGVDGATLEACVSPLTLDGLVDGAHVLEVVATDPAGNASPPAEYRWTVDTSPPAITITSGPSGTWGSTTAVFAFTADQGVMFRCSIDGSAPSSCTSPVTYTGLAAGSHTFTVAATNPDDGATSSIARTWTVDTTRPFVTLTGSPAGTVTTNTVELAFTSTKPGTFTCSLDSGSFKSCTSPVTYAGLVNGPHSFAVRSIDQGGNVSNTARASWTVDAAAPPLTIESGPSGWVRSRGATFTFTSPDAAATFACGLDRQTYQPCTSPVVYSGLPEGAHTFSVRASDAAGDTSLSAVHAWTIDVTAPAVTLTSPRAGTAYAAGTSFGIHTQGAVIVSGGASFTISATGQDAGPITMTFSVDGEALCDAGAPYTCKWIPTQGQHVVSVIGTDAAGNASNTMMVSVQVV